MATYLSGQSVRISTGTILSDAGPTDPSALVLTITLPDATTVTQTLTDFTRVSTGVYHYDYLPATAGQYDWRIVATGPATAAEGTFTVDAPGSHFPDPVELDDIKTYLNIPATSTKNDAELQGFINAAVGLVEELAGPIRPVVVTELCDGGGQQIVLSQWPVVTVTSVTDTLRTVTYTTDPTAGNSYVVEDGILTLIAASASPGRIWSLQPRFGYGTKNIQVVYTAGRAVVSEKLRKAIAEVVKHLWRTQQGSRMTNQSEEWAAGEAQGMTARVYELIGQDELGPRIA